MRRLRHWLFSGGRWRLRCASSFNTSNSWETPGAVYVAGMEHQFPAHHSSLGTHFTDSTVALSRPSHPSHPIPSDHLKAAPHTFSLLPNTCHAASTLLPFSCWRCLNLMSRHHPILTMLESTPQWHSSQQCLKEVVRQEVCDADYWLIITANTALLAQSRGETKEA